MLEVRERKGGRNKDAKWPRVFSVIQPRLALSATRVTPEPVTMNPTLLIKPPPTLPPFAQSYFKSLARRLRWRLPLEGPGERVKRPTAMSCFFFLKVHRVKYRSTYGFHLLVKWKTMPINALLKVYTGFTVKVICVSSQWNSSYTHHNDLLVGCMAIFLRLILASELCSHVLEFRVFPAFICSFSCAIYALRDSRCHEI